jgi:hypothetical protein
MAIDQDRKSMIGGVMAIMIFASLVIVADWLLVNGIMDKNYFIIDFFNRTFYKEGTGGFWKFRILYLILWMAVCFLIAKFKDNTYQKAFIVAAIFFDIIFIWGYTSFSFYNLIIYPFIFVGATVCSAKAVSKLKRKLKEEKLFTGVNQLKSDFMFVLPTTEYGNLIIHKPQQHIWIDGGPGSGKSQSLIKPILKQVAEMGYAGLVYDYEGDPTALGNPILTKVVYTAMLENRGKHKTKFAFINFTDMSRTVRVNIFSERYFTLSGRRDDAIADLYFGSLAASLLKNLNPEFKVKQDFWYNTALTVTKAVFMRLYRDEKLVKKGFNTLPHAIALFLKDYNLMFKWMIEDQYVEMLASSVLTPWREKASGQLAGTMGTLQVAFGKLLNPNIFWVLSKDDFDLDVTNKEHPTLLCLGNSQRVKDATSPVLSAIISCVTKQMNNPGKEKAVVCVDELPTVVIDGIDTFIATVRKHSVSVILAVQDHDQCKRDYGEKEATIVRASCGNQFFGMSGNPKEAKEIAESFGEIKKLQSSVSHSDGDEQQNINESLQKDKVLQSRDIIGLPVGAFVGKIANGEPPHFKVRFKDFKYDTVDIPHFGYTVKTKPDIAEAFLQVQVQTNYDKINRDVDELLKKYMVSDDYE